MIWFWKYFGILKFRNNMYMFYFDLSRFFIFLEDILILFIEKKLKFGFI